VDKVRAATEIEKKRPENWRTYTIWCCSRYGSRTK
jgi:hypothetical protein